MNNEDLYEIFKRYSYNQLQVLAKKAKTKDEQDFYMLLSNMLLQKQQAKVCQLDRLTPVELKEIEESDRLEWQEDTEEELIEKTIEEKIEEEMIRLAKNVLDVLDNETIAESTGLDIELIQSLRI